MNDELLAKVRAIIQALEQEKAKLQSGTSAYSQYDHAIQVLTKNLKAMNGEFALSSKQLSTLYTQIQKVVTAFESGEAKRISTFGGRIRTSAVTYSKEAYQELLRQQAVAPGAVRTGQAGDTLEAQRQSALKSIRDAISALTQESRQFDIVSKEALEYAHILSILEKATRDYAQDIEGLNAALREYAAFRSRMPAGSINLGQIPKPQLQQSITDDVERQRLWLQARQNISSVIGEQAATRVYQRAAQIDPLFGPETLKTVDIDPTTGIAKLKFQYETAEGIIKRSTLVVDKFGTVLVDTQKRFRSFGDALARDIGEFTKWSLAAAIVYVPLQKLSELLTAMIDIEARLTDITIVMGDAQADTTQIFRAAYDIAQQTGEGIVGVVEAYRLAYQATGGVADQTARLATTQKLLSNAISLSRLSTLSQAEAIDVLSAALRQVGKGFDYGEALLNKWVRVSRIANVDLETLAVSFATVADTADAAGIPVDKLNAIIAVIAESTDASAKEVANATKAVIESFQTDQAREYFDSLGVAYQTVSGEALNFLDIITQVNQKVEQGLITEAQYNELLSKQGGGPRRKPQVAALYSAQDKLQAIERESGLATDTSGEAAQAVQRTLDNVQSAVERLNNAFISLAQTLGTKGGILDVFTFLANAGTVVLEVLTKLFDLLGKSGPMLTLALGASAYLRDPARADKGRAFVGGLAKRLIPWNIPGADATTINERLQAVTGMPVRPMRGEAASLWATRNAGTIAGAGTVGLMAVGNFLSGNAAQGWGNLAGGAIVGALTKSSVGAIVGASIAEAIVNGIINYKADLTDFAKGIYGEATEEEQPAEPRDVAAELREQASRAALRAIGYGNEAYGKVTGFFGDALIQGAGFVGGLMAGTPFKGMSQGQSALVQAELMQQGAKLFGNPLMNWLFGGAVEENYQEAISLLQRAEAIEKGKEAERALTPAERSPLQDAALKYTKMLRDQFLAGDISLSAYRGGIGQMEKFPAVGSSYMAAFGSQLGPEAADIFGRILAFGKEDVRNELNKYAQEIIYLNIQLQNSNLTLEERQKKQADVNRYTEEAIALIKQQNNELLAQATVLDRIDLTKLTRQEAQSVIDKAMELQNKVLQDQVDLGKMTAEQKEAVINNLEEMIVAYDRGVLLASKTTADFIQQAIEELKLAKDEATKPLGFSGFDLTSEEFKRIIGWTDFNAPDFQRFQEQMIGAGYEIQPEPWIAVMKDGVIQPMQKDWKLVQFYLSEILKVEEKQLDGMYNLPEGATFWIPYQAAKYGLRGETPTGEERKYTAGEPYDFDTWKKFRDAEEASMRRTAVSAPRNTNAMDAYSIAMNYAKQAELHDQPPYGTYSQQMQKFRAADAFSMLTPVAGVPDFSNRAVIPNVKIPELNTRLNLNLTANTTVTLDKNVLGTMIKKFIYEGLLRYSPNNSVSNSNVIAQ